MICRKSLRLFCLLAAVVCPAFAAPFDKCTSNSYPPLKKWKIPTAVINLDLPPAERWKNIGADYADKIRHLIDTLKSLLLVLGEMAKILLRIVDNEWKILLNTLPQPYRDEIIGMAAASKINTGEILLYNIFYEIFTVCTSIVAEDSKGKLYHARNLDFGLFLGWDTRNHSWLITEALRPTIVNLDFQKGGKTVFKSVNFAGYIGILTAVRPGYFTLTMNERFRLEGGFIGILDWITGKRTGKWMGFLTRDTMLYANSYEEAKDMLNNTQMLAPAYFILGGNKSGEGCVITRAIRKSEDVWEMSEAGGWYILETNYDHWKAPLFIDDRRTPANTCMKNLTQQHLTRAALFDVLSTRPVLNKLTAYTALMEVDSGHLESWIQYCDDPCWPW